MSRPDLLLRAEHLRAQRTPFVLATVVRAQRPTSAKAGDAALVLPDGTLDGFVGGTCAESTVRVQGLRLLESGQSTLLRITPVPDEADLDPVDGVVTVANPCLSGGTLEIFLEAMIPPTLVHVYGAGPVARALAEVGTATGYEMVASTDPSEAIPADATAVVVASHGHDEEPVLRAALAADVPYVALVASRRRAAAVLAGLPDADRVHAPAGLDLGAHTPPEIALSILAEIIESRPRRAAPPAPGADSEQPLGSTATDPVCHMEVAVTPHALRLDFAQHTFYFCGSGCRSAFGDQPERYLS
jgi:xanthine dehydrogenase accessory factor